MAAPNRSELFTCAICVDSYDDVCRLPLTLECGHSLCAECFGQLPDRFSAGRVTRKCPFCRTLVPVTAPRNIALLQALDRTPAAAFARLSLSSRDGSMQIFFKGVVSGHTSTLTVKGTDSVEHLKMKIREIEGVPAGEQRLVCGGKTLQDGHTLADYNIRQHSTIHMTLRLLGGCGRAVI